VEWKAVRQTARGQGMVKDHMSAALRPRGPASANNNNSNNSNNKKQAGKQTNRQASRQASKQTSEQPSQQQQQTTATADTIG